MTTPAPIYVRMFQVKDIFGVSDDQVRIWEQKGLVQIYKRGRMSFVRSEQLSKVIEQSVG